MPNKQNKYLKHKGKIIKFKTEQDELNFKSFYKGTYEYLPLTDKELKKFKNIAPIEFNFFSALDLIDEEIK